MMTKEMVLAELKTIYDDLDKICDAAGDGFVPYLYDENGDIVETKPYTMSDNAFSDVCGLWQAIRTILVKNGMEVL